MHIFHYKHIFTFIFIKLRYTREPLHLSIWTIQHLTVTLTFKDHWPHDLHQTFNNDNFLEAKGT